MACCILTAYVMNRLIKACEVLNLDIINLQYNQFDKGPPPALLPRASSDKNSVPEDTYVASKFSIQGMTCAACTRAIESAALALPGVDRVSVSLPLARATVVHRPSQTTASDIVAAIEGSGYGANLGRGTAGQNLEMVGQSKELEQLRKAFGSASMLASVGVGVEWTGGMIATSDYQGVFRFTTMAIGTWVQLVDASWIHEGAWAKGGTTLTMDTLISLSLLLGLALSFFNIALFGLEDAETYFSSGSFLTVVIIGGRYLDHLLRRQSAANLASLYRLQTESTMVKVRRTTPISDAKAQTKTPEMTTATIPTAMLRPRDEIMIPQDSIIPCDCYILEGRSMVDQSTMTGESIPMNKSPGGFLMAGTRNLSYELVAFVVRSQEESALELLVGSIEDATETQSQEGDGGDHLTGSFVGIILCLTFVGFCWTLFMTHSTSTDLNFSHRLNTAAERAMAILASACPCALGLAAPSAVMAAIDVAWTRGVILKGGLETVNTLTKLKNMVMDKTGTLTTGKLSVAEESVHLEPWQRMLLCAAERDDAVRHPVAKAVFQWAFSGLTDEQRREQNDVLVRNHMSGPGKGVACEASLVGSPEWWRIHIGTAAFLVENGIEVPGSMAAAAGSDMTMVQIALNDAHLATLTLRDTIRPEAPSVIQHLKSHFNLSITMLTGDIPSEAARVSKELDIPVLSSQTLPHEKATFIQQLKSGKSGSGGKVAMLGDGLNDAPALSAADVGIFLSPSLASTSLGNASRSQAQPQSSTSSIILTSPSLVRLPEVLSIAHKTAAAAKWIRRWAVAYNVVAVALAMDLLEGWGVKIDAARAGSMMALSSVSVLAWGLWLRRKLGGVRYDPQDGDGGTR